VASFEVRFYKLQFLVIQIDLTTKIRVRLGQFLQPMGKFDLHFIKALRVTYRYHLTPRCAGREIISFVVMQNLTRGFSCEELWLV
jgi:hypothetical protein